MKTLSIPEVAAFLLQGDRYVILTHRRPDGDTIGCAAALCGGLRQLGKQAAILENPQFTAKFRPYLDGLTVAELPENACLIAVDIASSQLLPYNAVNDADRIEMLIDHHGRNNGYAKRGFVDPETAACGELILKLLLELKVTGTPRIAEALYVAISTDTGCFRYSNTTADTLRAAAYCRDCGACRPERSRWSRRSRSSRFSPRPIRPRCCSRRTRCLRRFRQKRSTPRRRANAATARIFGPNGRTGAAACTAQTANFWRWRRANRASCGRSRAFSPYDLLQERKIKMKRVIALGFFDGVHLGHGALLRRTRELADRLGCPAAALTLDTHPDNLLRGTPTRLLNTPVERRELMQTLYGIDEVLALHFDAATMRQPWQEFVERTLIGAYSAVHLVCGADYRCGSGGAGTAELLQAFCAARGVGCDVIPQLSMDGAAVSSSRIRGLIASGEMAEAVRLLGHPHLLSGTVVTGHQLGRTIGIPTANLDVSPQILLPMDGVYAAETEVDGRRYPAVTNIGMRPTVHGDCRTVEPWLLDFSGDLYGRRLTLRLLTFLRGERRFPSLDALQAEIRRNAEQTRALLSDAKR